jgi:hypothetical protein
MTRRLGRAWRSVFWCWVLATALRRVEPGSRDRCTWVGTIVAMGVVVQRGAGCATARGMSWEGRCMVGYGGIVGGGRNRGIVESWNHHHHHGHVSGSVTLGEVDGGRRVVRSCELGGKAPSATSPVRDQIATEQIGGMYCGRSLSLLGTTADVRHGRHALQHCSTAAPPVTTPSVRSPSGRNISIRSPAAQQPSPSAARGAKRDELPARPSAPSPKAAKRSLGRCTWH